MVKLEEGRELRATLKGAEDNGRQGLKVEF